MTPIKKILLLVFLGSLASCGIFKKTIAQDPYLQLLKKSNEAYKLDRFDSSLVYLNQCIELFHNNKDTSSEWYPICHAKMGDTYTALREFRKARTSYKTAFEVSNEESAYYIYDYIGPVCALYDSLALHDSLFYDSLLSPKVDFVKMYFPIDTMEMTGKTTGIIKLPLTKAQSFKDEYISLYRMKSGDGMVELIKLGEGKESGSSKTHTHYNYTANDTSVPAHFQGGRHFVYTENYAHVDSKDQLAQSFLSGMRFYGTFSKVSMGYKMVITRDFQFYKKHVLDIYRSSLDDIAFRYRDSSLAFVSHVMKTGYYKGRKVIDVMQEATRKDIELYLQRCNDHRISYMEKVSYFPEFYAGWLLQDAPMKQGQIDDIFKEQQEAGEVDFKQFGHLVEENNMVEYWLSDADRMKKEGNFLQAVSQMELIQEYATYSQDESLLHECKLGLGEIYRELGQENLSKTLLNQSLDFFSKTDKHQLASRAKTALNELLDPKEVEVMVQSHHQTHFYMVHHPNGNFFYTAGWDGMIKKWDLKSQRIIIDKKSRHNFMQDIKISADGNYITTFDRSGLIVVYESYNLNEIWTFQPNDYMTDIDISRDGKYVAYLVADSNAYLVDWQHSDSIIALKKHSKQVTCIAFDASKDAIYTGSRDSSIILWNLADMKSKKTYNESSQVFSISLSPNGIFMASVRRDSLVGLWNTYEFSQIGTLRTQFYSSLDQIYFSSPSFSHDNLLMAMMNPKGEYVYVSLDELRYRTFRNSDDGFVHQLCFHPTQRLLFGIDADFKIKKSDLRPYQRRKTQTVLNTYIENHSIMLYRQEFSGDGSQLHLLTIGKKMNLQNYSLRNGKGETVLKDIGMVQNEITGGNSAIDFTQNLYLENEEGGFDHHFALPYKLFPYCLDMKRNIIYGIYRDSSLRAYHMGSKKLLFENNVPDSIKKDNGIQKLKYIPSIMKIIVHGHAHELLFYDAKTGERTVNPKLQFDDRIQQFATGLNNRYCILYSMNLLVAFDLQEDKVIYELPIDDSIGFLSAVTIHPNGRYIAYGNRNFRAIIYDIQNDDTLYRSSPFSWFVARLNFNPTKPVMAITPVDNVVLLADYKDSSQLLTIHPRANGTYLATIDSGYYWAPKNALNGITFKKGKKVYPVESFDYYYNRPDKILAKSPFKDELYLNALEAAVAKRLKGDLATPNFKNLPSLIIRNRENMEEVVRFPNLKLIVETADFQSNVKSIFVTINGVPSNKNKAYDAGSSKKAITEISLELNQGLNRIAVWCVNENGLQSFKENLMIHYTPMEEQATDLYLVVLSVSEYANSDYNLKYAVKDGRDFVKSFDSVAAKYQHVYVDTLFNARAIKSNLEAVRKRLSESKPNDKIIVFVSGHGLLDKDFNFYFASYDCDFNNPKEKGIPYSMIEGLFDHAAARKRMLLIDACHSGEVDKDLAYKTTQVVSEEGARGNVKIAYRGAKVKNSNKNVGLENSFELMKELFADIGSKGIQVISAAAGNSYALESDIWGNGVFTSSVLKAYDNQQADLNADGDISVSELRNFVTEEVYRLTNGRQRPTVRNENIEYDFGVW